MTRARRISTSASNRWWQVLCLSGLICLLSLSPASAQRKIEIKPDSVPLFNGFSVSADLVGAAQLLLSDYGQYEAALRLNLRDKYFPIIEVGYGRANHEDDEVTGVTYKTKAPYFRIGADVNLARQKHSGNRIYIGLRYAYTNYKVDITRQPFPDPVWQWDTSFGVKDEACYQHWAELVFGIDAKVYGPLHLGWSVRYKRRLAHDDGKIGNTWYVPGYGKQDSNHMGATFNVIIDI